MDSSLLSLPRTQSSECPSVPVMDEERHSGSNYSSSLSSSRPRSSAAATRFNIKGADRLVKIELEAAEVLADLAQSLIRESESNGAESGGKWGSKGKRGRKRVKSESPPSDAFKNLDNLLLGSSDLTEVGLGFYALTVCRFSLILLSVESFCLLTYCIFAILIFYVIKN